MAQKCDKCNADIPEEWKVTRCFRCVEAEGCTWARCAECKKTVKTFLELVVMGGREGWTCKDCMEVRAKRTLDEQEARENAKKKIKGLTPIELEEAAKAHAQRDALYQYYRHAIQIVTSQVMLVEAKEELGDAPDWFTALETDGEDEIITVATYATICRFMRDAGRCAQAKTLQDIDQEVFVEYISGNEEFCGKIKKVIDRIMKTIKNVSDISIDGTGIHLRCEE